MEMSYGEIVMSYRRAQNRRMQVGILADLNQCSEKEIENILLAAGEELPKGRTKKEVKEQKEIPETISKILMSRIEELDTIIRNAEKEYKEIVVFLGLGGKE